MSIGTAVLVLALAIFGLLGAVRFVWMWHNAYRRRREAWRQYIRRTY